MNMIKLQQTVKGKTMLPSLKKCPNIQAAKDYLECTINKTK